MNIKHFALALLISLLPAVAQAGPANMLIYIHPQEYTHPVKLWHFYSDHWFEQGPLVEPVVKSALAEEYGEVDMCKAGSEGRSLVWIKPRMYYNPHMTTFYGEITAIAYTGNGESIASYVGESQKIGFLDVYPRLSIVAAYKMAMEDLIRKMRKDQRLKAVAAKGAINADAGSACAIITTLPPPKPIDLDYIIKSVN
ncbi:MAG: hypothetical protein CVU35_03890 [Betaproteobacteria bacterium HGW-Betaproteobacteria-8]|nr:MAG: hypothetical protein CVU35_03890 [Betaproteobacteria bacterium HGW-Betaproteobacteria-8]